MLALLNLGFAGTASTTTNIWSEVSANSALYDVVRRDQTQWDGGNSVWDIDGNVIITDWDVSTTTYSAASTNSVTWSEE